MIVIMSGDLMERLARLAERDQRHAAGSVLFREGDPVRSLFLVMTGEVRLVRTLPHGFLLTLQRAGPGAVLAEASVFADRYHCDALAAEPSFVRVVPLPRIIAALSGDAAMAAAFLRHLASEVLQARARAETLSLKTLAERLDAWIALNGGSLPPRGRWRRLAAETGVTPEALYRQLACRR